LLSSGMVISLNL